jgi:tetratricopeptide (TPR) repeat protein
MILVTIAVIIFITRCNTEEFEFKTTQSFLSGNNPETVINAKRWIKRDLRNPIPHAILNLVYAEMGNYDLLKIELRLAYNSVKRRKIVLDWSSKLVEENKNNSRAYLINGTAFDIARNNQLAISSYLKAINIDQNCKQCLQSLGNLYLYTEQFQKALNVYSEMICRYPDDASSYVCVGLIYDIFNDMEKAIENFEKAVELEPNNLINLYNLSEAYIKIEAKNKAIEILRKIVELDPDGEIGQESKSALSKLVTSI